MAATQQPNKNESKARMLLAEGLGLLLLGLAYQYWTPKIYQARALIEFSGREKSTATAADAKTSKVSGLFAEYQYFGSSEFLDQVVQNLHLRETWGARQTPPTELTADTARLRLRAKARVELVPFEKVIDITVVSEERNETAAIANEMARIYWEHRQAEKQRLTEGALTAMTDKLKPLWEEASTKARAAQERLNAVTEEIKRARVASGDILYDPAAMDQLQAQRIKLEGEYVEVRNMQLQLKGFNHTQLREVLPTIGTNVLLDKSLDALIHAQTELALAKSAKGANSQEVARASAVVAELDQRVEQVVSGIMIGRETDVAVKKSALDALTEKLSHARTSVAASLTTSNEEYQAALGDLKKASQERDMITNRLSVTSAVESLAGTAEIVDEAQTPSKPVSPDENLTRGMLVIGGLAFVAGLALLLTSSRVKPPSTPPARSTVPFTSPRRN